MCAFQVWHAVGTDRKPLRKQYLEAILPPFAAVLRRWRPLLAGIHELATNDGLNPLDVKDGEFFGDVESIEVSLVIYHFIIHISSVPSHICQNSS